QYDSAQFEGYEVASAWQGTAQEPADEKTGPYDCSVTLDRVGFVTSYGGLTRDPNDATPITFVARFARQDGWTITGTFVPQNGPASLSFTETWSWQGPGGTEPIWRNERIEIEGHDPIPQSTKDQLFQTYASYHALPEVQPYVNRPEFQAAMHFVIFDPTDYDFYQAHPNTLRVIQKVIDPISLAETKVRALAYGQTLAQKEQYFEPLMPAHHLNQAGMLVYYDPNGTPPYNQPHSGDSMLWTGVYVASQALRYLVTGAQVALDNMITALHGEILCFDIVGQDGQFARTIRLHVSDGNPKWVQGQGPYSIYDWETGCNNDMLKGYFVGFAWAYMALKDLSGYDQEKTRMVQILENLKDHNPDCQGTTSGNKLLVNMLLYWMTGDVSCRLRYQSQFSAERTFIVDYANGASWEYGTSDWSGNHLHLQSMLTMYQSTSQAGDGSTAGDVQEGMANGLDIMRHTRLGLYQLVMATLGDFTTPPPELDEALWVLREFPAPKVSLAYDWSINPAFCMSPFPELPWKNDWTTADRTQSIRSHPLFERPQADVYVWKSGAFDYRSGATTWLAPGADYLFAYWFGRYFGVITATM
ncbi:MAG: hypothetical protein J7M25_14765, partial [Deltaproteobacteria bacterium]|nr:hypothetical protein [Deltaproteobacteria bacterium]